MIDKNFFAVCIYYIKKYFSNYPELSVEIISLGGSRAIGLENQMSDYDFYMVYEGSSLYDKKKMTVWIETLPLDIRCCSCQTIKAHNVNYHPEFIQYPSILYRTQKQMNENKINKNIDREDFYRGLVYQTLLNDMVWTQHPKEAYFDCMDHILDIRAVADYYFTRAWGNYIYCIKDHTQISIRKYLYTIYEILYCQWLLTKKIYPPFNFLELISSISEVCVYEIKELYVYNRIGEKVNIDSSETRYLNEFLEKKLNQMIALFQNTGSNI